jgi:acetyl esterase/lipase
MDAKLFDDILVEDVEYYRHAGEPLLARLYRPKHAVTAPALISLHGGRWVGESRLSNAAIDAALARGGALVMAIDIRKPPVARYPDCIADLNVATRWLKQHAGELGSRPELVGGIGTSSGGHQLMTSAMRPRDPRYGALPLPGEYDAALAFIVVAWPVIDPLARYRMVKEKNMTGYFEAHEAYWPSEDAIAEGNPQLILERGENVLLPPTLYIQGAADAALPSDMADRFAIAYRRAGGTLDLKKFDGQGHTFMTKQPDSAATLAALEIIEAFVRYRTALLTLSGLR